MVNTAQKHYLTK